MSRKIENVHMKTKLALYTRASNKRGSKNEQAREFERVHTTSRYRNSTPIQTSYVYINTHVIVSWYIFIFIRYINILCTYYIHVNDEERSEALQSRRVQAGADRLALAGSLRLPSLVFASCRAERLQCRPVSRKKAGNGRREKDVTRVSKKASAKGKAS